jgi:hypothetical protein
MWECKPCEGNNCFVLSLDGVGVIHGTRRDVINCLRRWRYRRLGASHGEG